MPTSFKGQSEVESRNTAASDAFVAVPHQPAHEVRPHPPQSDHPELQLRPPRAWPPFRSGTFSQRRDRLGDGRDPNRDAVQVGHPGEPLEVLRAG